MQKIVTHLWFDHQAEDAAKFYTSIFKNSKMGNIARYGDSAAAMTGRPAGSAMTVQFDLDGQPFYALNGGPIFKFTEAISLVANCDDQMEVDRLWGTLSQGGQSGQCGWLKDKYGLSWQIVPTVLREMMQDTNPKKTENVMKALLQMTKLDIAGLEQAYRKQ